MSIRPDPQADIARIRATIISLRDRLEQGEHLDLGGLTRDVGALCEQLAAMPGPAARPHAEALAEMMADLDGLEGLLRGLRGDLDRRIAEMSGSGGEGAA